MAAPFVAGTIWRSARLLHEVRFYGIPYSPVFVQRQPESDTGFAHRIATPDEVRQAEAAILNGQQRRTV